MSGLLQAISWMSGFATFYLTYKSSDFKVTICDLKRE